MIPFKYSLRYLRLTRLLPGQMILEVFSIAFLIHGLASKEQGGLFETTRAILGQLRSNEHLRVFSVLVRVSFVSCAISNGWAEG